MEYKLGMSEEERLAFNEEYAREQEIRHKIEEILIQKYALLGIIMNPSIADPSKIGDVKIDFTDAEWVDLLNAEGEFLPRCCADISSIRDNLSYALRDNRMISVKKLFECKELIIGHGCNQPDEHHPLQKLLKLCETIKSDCDFDVRVFVPDPKNPKHALSAISDIAVDMMFPSSNDKQEDKVCKIQLLYRLMPNLHTLYNYIHTLFPESMDCWVICEGDKAVEARAGLAVYVKKETAEYILKYLQENTEMKDLVLKPAVASVEHGIVF